MARKLSDEFTPTNVDPALVQACLAEYTELSTQSKRLAQKTAAMLRRYEAQGINVKSIRATDRASRQDRAIAAAQARSDVQYMFLAGVLKIADEDWASSVVQTDMFDAGQHAGNGAIEIRVNPQLAKARAYSDGYNTGRHGGETASNNFSPGTEEYVAWDKGHRDGYADRGLSPKKGAKAVRQADDTPRRPRRPRKPQDGDEIVGHA